MNTQLPIDEQPTTILPRKVVSECPYEAGNVITWEDFNEINRIGTVQFVTPITYGSNSTHEVTVYSDGETITLLWPNGGEGATLRMLERVTVSDATPTTLQDTPEKNAEREYHAGLIEAYVAHVKAVQKNVLAEMKLAHKCGCNAHDMHANRITQQFTFLINEGFKISTIIYADDCVKIGEAL